MVVQSETEFTKRFPILKRYDIVTIEQVESKLVFKGKINGKYSNNWKNKYFWS